MPLFLSLHDIHGPDPTSTVKDLHRSISQGDNEYGATCLRSWLSPETHTLYCLIEGDTRYLADQLHRRSELVTHIETPQVLEIQ